MSNIISFDDGEILDVDTHEGAYKYVARFLRQHGATGDVFSKLTKLYREPDNVCLQCEAPLDSHSWREEVMELRKMLSAALPNIECKTDEQSSIISWIGEYLSERSDT